MKGALHVSQFYGSEAHGLHGSAFISHHGPVSHANALFKQDEKTADEIFHQGLGAEPHGKAHNAGTGQNGGGVDPETFQHDDASHKSSCNIDGGSDHGDKGFLFLADFPFFSPTLFLNQIRCQGVADFDQQGDDGNSEGDGDCS